MKQTIRQRKEAGAVSLFVVIFAMLLLTVITVSFLRLMMNDQSQATNSDMSQSAYDSAQAGVEDAKRALLRYQRDCPDGNCALSSLMRSQICNESVVRGLGGAAAADNKYPEVLVQQSGSINDRLLDQAYTCVTMSLDTNEYEGAVAANTSRLVPLKVAQGVSFDTVEVQWFSREDVTSSAIDLPNIANKGNLDSWQQNRPSVLRAQLMQYGSDYQLEHFDATVGGRSNTNTVFMYPVDMPSKPTTFALSDRDVRASSPGGEAPKDLSNNSPMGVSCVRQVASSADYACAARFTIPEPYNGDATSRTAYLRLTAFYNPTHFKVVLYNGGNVVQFNEAQAIVDSTGRANDLFRRIQSRVDLVDTSMPFPEAAVDLTGNFCKDFSVTDDSYVANTGPTGCQP